MPRQASDCETRSAPRFRHALGVWVMCWCPLLLLMGCAVPAPITRLVVPAPPPQALAAECSAGPGWPSGDVPLGDLLDVVAQRERAAADCRARHRGLVDAWPR